MQHISAFEVLVELDALTTFLLNGFPIKLKSVNDRLWLDKRGHSEHQLLKEQPFVLKVHLLHNVFIEQLF